MLRRLSLAVAALVCLVLLSACSVLPIRDDSDKVAAVQMKHIADAVKASDAAVLKGLFSSEAREKSTDLDSELKAFMLVFPSGAVTWKSQGTGLTGVNEALKEACDRDFRPF